jgi:hypothetical protein
MTVGGLTKVVGRYRRIIGGTATGSAKPRAPPGPPEQGQWTERSGRRAENKVTLIAAGATLVAACWG